MSYGPSAFPPVWKNIITYDKPSLIRPYEKRMNADELALSLRETISRGLVLYLPFVRFISHRADTITKVFDRSPFGNHGTIYGAVWQTLPSGKSALSFDGVDDYCYDEATEVLTLRGWIPFKELTTNDLVATLNPQTNELEYQRPKRLISYYYEGKMVKVSGRHIDLLVTPNHRMFVSVNKGANIWDEYKLLPAEEILDKKVKYKKDCVWKGQRVEFFELPSVIYKINQHRTEERDAIKIPMDDWLEFFGYYISEGYCKYNEKKPEYSVVIAQSPEKKERIEQCLKRLPFKFSYKDGKFYINSKQLASYLKQFGKAEDKFIPSWMKQLASDQLKILLNALMYGDGHRNQYYTKSKKLADDIQEIAFKIGFSADISYWSNRKSPIYCVGIQKTNIRPTAGEKRIGIDWNLANHELVDYRGMVYCCEVPKYHIIYVRRNGKAVWSGNCEIPDSGSLNITNEITIAVWMKSNMDGTVDELVSRWGSEKAYKLGIYSNNRMDFRINFVNSGIITRVTKTLSANAWYHLVGVYDGDDMISYVNAVVVDIYNVGSDTIAPATGPLRIGSSPSDTNHFNGAIDEVRIYNRALSEDEIRRLYELTCLLRR